MSKIAPAIQIVRLQRHNPHLLADLDVLYRGFAAEEGHITPPEHFREFVAARLDDTSMLVILAQVDNLTAGHISTGYALVFDVREHPFIPNWQRSGYITQMFVDKDFRRQGIGKRLVDFSLTWLRQKGVPQVMLNVDVDNEDGERFWHQSGFTPHLVRMKKDLALC